MNEFMIGAKGENLVFLRPVPQQITKEQAITLAAWLVAMTDKDAFDKKFDEVCT